MNVLHTTRRYKPCIGGVENYIEEISKRLIKKSIDCRVLTLDYDIFDKNRKLDKHEVINDIDVFRIPGFGHYKKPIPLKIPLELFKWADIIHTHDLRFLYETSLILKNVLKFKLVLSTHGFLLHTKDMKLIKDIAIPAYYKPSIKNIVDYVICDSKQDYDYFGKERFANLHLIENGIDYDKFSSIKRKPVPGRLLYYGRIDKNKGLDLLFQALALIKDLDWQIDIAGGGFEKSLEELKATAVKLGISNRINWQGFIQEKQLLDLLSVCHLCLFPSRYEGFGLTLIEAMAGACVCAANSIPTYSDMITDNSDGFLVDFFKPEEAAETIKRLLNTSNGSLSEISQKAKSSSRKYNWDDKINKLISIYKNGK